MGYAPDLWGPATWDTIHLLCYTAPETLGAAEQLRYIAFFKALPYVLPCASCSQHLLGHYESHPIENAVASRDSLFEWSVAVHNAVNVMLGKPVMPLETARQRWAKRLGTVGAGAGAGNDAPEMRLFGARGYAWILVAFALFAIVLAVFLLTRKQKRG